jgi:hypothetical protein
MNNENHVDQELGVLQSFNSCDVLDKGRMTLDDGNTAKIKGKLILRF